MAGCFDVPQVAVEPMPLALLIDDFEDGDNVPSSVLFEAWHCETSPAPPRASCEPATTGALAGMAEVVRFELANPANGSFDDVSVTLGTSTRLGTLDLRDYENLAFRAKLELTPAIGEASAENRSEVVDLFVQLACDGVGQSGGLPYGSWLEARVSVGPEWSSSNVALEQLIRPNHVLDLNRSECLANVEALVFVLGFEQSDEEVLAGLLAIDDVSLK